MSTGINPRILNRKLHRWGAIAVAVPFLVVILTGLLLQLKKQFDWVQPPEARGASASPALSMADILERAQRVPEAGVRGWEDIDRVDLRPSKGMLKVVTMSRWELQLDASTGELLGSAYRRSDLIESVHDGSFFHTNAKLFLFLPVAVVVLALWITGIYLWLLPYRVRWARRASSR